MPISPYMASIRAKIGKQLIEIPSVSVLVFDDEDRVVLVRHAEYDQWTTPGGAVEPEEIPTDAAVREMFEETGLHVRIEGVIGVYGGPQFTTTYRNGDRVSFLMVAFLGSRISGEPRPDFDETLEVGYFARSEIESLDAQPWVKAVLEDAWRDRARTHFAAPNWAPESSAS